MSPISQKVKRFLENNFEKNLSPPEKSHQHTENAGFFYCEKNQTFSFFLFFIVIARIEIRVNHDSVSEKNARKIGRFYVSLTIRISKTVHKAQFNHWIELYIVQFALGIS